MSETTKRLILGGIVIFTTASAWSAHDQSFTGRLVLTFAAIALMVVAVMPWEKETT